MNIAANLSKCNGLVDLRVKPHLTLNLLNADNYVEDYTALFCQPESIESCSSERMPPLAPTGINAHGSEKKNSIPASMRLTFHFGALASAIALACPLTAALSIAGSADGSSILRDVTARVPSDKVTFEYYEGGAALMAPHDVELVRRASWTYKNSKPSLYWAWVCS